MRPILSLLPLILNWAVQSLASTQFILGNDEPSTPFNPSFNDFVEHLMSDWHVPGLAIAVIHENQTWTKGFGYASLDSKEPFTPYTLFQGASTTKSFTSSLTALLVDNKEEYGSIEWLTPLHDVVGNDFVLKDSYSTTHVSFLDALSHRTGMPRHDGVWYDQKMDVKTQTYRLRYLSPSAQLRVKWQYCNLMYTAVSHALQTVTGMFQVDMLREWIFEPLGMNHSYYSMHDATSCQKSHPDCKMADSYTWNNETSSYQKWPLEANHPPNGAGGIISNVVDYAKWLRTLMYESGPVSKEGHAMLKTTHSVESTEAVPYTGPQWYGLGLDGGVYRNHRTWGHNGAIAGYSSRINFLPEQKFGFVIFQNSQGYYAMECMGWRLVDEFLGIPEEEYMDLNKTYFEKAAKAQEELVAQPSKLYPSVSSIPVQPRLPLQNYTGTYMHPGYGNFSISLHAPSGMLFRDADVESSGSAGLPLYATSKYESVLYTFRHVSAEYWLVEVRSLLYNSRLPDQYTKARFEVGADGSVEQVGIIMEGQVAGDEAWVWFNRAERKEGNKATGLEHA